MIYFLFYCEYFFILHLVSSSTEDGGLILIVFSLLFKVYRHNPSLIVSSLHAALRISWYNVWFGSQVASVQCRKTKQILKLATTAGCLYVCSIFSFFEMFLWDCHSSHSSNGKFSLNVWQQQRTKSCILAAAADDFLSTTIIFLKLTVKNRS